MRQYVYRLLGKQVELFTKYCNEIVQIDKSSANDILLDKINHPKKSQIKLENFDQIANREHLALLINGNLNHSNNIQDYLELIYKHISRSSRIICVVYNSYFSSIYSLANKLKIRKGPLPQTFLTQVDLENLFKLSNFEITYESHIALIPFSLFGLGDLLNKIVKTIPIIKKLSFFTLIILRPIKESPQTSLSIVIPARNERGNIENALIRMPDFGARKVQVVFVEGNSSDGTYDEIVRVCSIPKYLEKFNLKYTKQKNKGKYDAVKEGFEICDNDLLIILDADLTMPPELLPQFVIAFEKGRADFINGSRLVYPMEKNAMRFLNLLGNKFFAKAIGTVLKYNLSDTLCGTKVMTRTDYMRLKKWRHDFGEFDPFGDFELLFSASVLNLGIVNIPVAYRDRVYGSTQISRFRDGFILLKMTFIAFFKISLKRF